MGRLISEYPPSATPEEKIVLSGSQSWMLHTLQRWNYARLVRFGEEWVEPGELVMDFAGRYDSHLAWRIADRVFGALDRRGCIERHPGTDDLVRVSEAALAMMGLGGR